MSGHAGGHTETIKPPVHPEIAEDEIVPPSDVDAQGEPNAEPKPGEGARENDNGARPKTVDR